MQRDEDGCNATCVLIVYDPDRSAAPNRLNRLKLEYDPDDTAENLRQLPSSLTCSSRRSGARRVLVRCGESMILTTARSA